MKKVTLLTVISLATLLGTASAQQVDAAFGFNALHATAAANAGSNYSPQSVGGGLTPSFSADFLLPNHFGVGTEFSWRGSKAIYQPATIDVPYRPFFYDFNAIFAPPITKNITAEVMAGIGAENTRFYVAPSCGINCQNYSTTNHFMGHFGGGIRFYPKGNFFIRPEAHWYLVRNNNQFSSPYATRYGVSIGYSFGGHH